MYDMTFREYVKNLNDLLKKRPDIAAFKVVTSKDDEGNGYNLVRYTPTVGAYDMDDRYFTTETDSSNINAVCVN